MLAVYLSMLETEDERNNIALLYEQYQRRLVYYAKRFLQIDKAAEEAVHEAFISAIKHKEIVFSLSSVEIKRWLFVTVENKCIDLLRSSARKPQVYMEDLEEEPFSEEPTVDSQVIEQESYSKLRAYITALDEPNRQIVEMKYILGMASKEIGKIFHLSAAQVDNRLTRAKKKIRAAIESEMNLHE